MNNKTLFFGLIVACLSSGYPALKVVPANPPVLIAQSVWKPFSSKEGGFTILLPGTPTQETSRVNTDVGPVSVKRFYVIRNNEALYGVAYSDFPNKSSLNSGEINQLLAQVVSGFVQGSRGKLVSQKPIRLGDFPGREVRIQLPQGVIARGRIYWVNNRLYQVVVATNKENSLTKTIEGFFNSFRLPNNSAPSPSKPSLEELSTELTQSVCSQNWPQALKIIDQMVAIAPNPEIQNQLVTYRGRIQNLANSGSKIPPEELPECTKRVPPP